MKHRCCSAEVIYFVFSSEMETRTLSQMCGILYLPIFLFRVGLLTNIYCFFYFCLCNTYFLFQGQFYEQTKEAAMGSSVSPIVATLYMESFEHKAITSAVNPPRIWKRYVDDTFVILQQSHRNEFLQHINSVAPPIIFTTEEIRLDGSMPFLDTLITPQKDETLSTSVYRKLTHTDLYLPWDCY